MNSDDDRHAAERFVAGLPVEDDELARALVRQAAEREMIVRSIVGGLADARASVRRRLAMRAGQMRELDPAIAARLGVLAEHDPDPTVRLASEDALRAQRPVDPVRATPKQPTPRGFLRLALKLDAVRGGSLDSVELVAEYGEPRDLRATVTPDGLTVRVVGLADQWIDTEPELVASDLGRIGAAVAPVDADGVLILRVDVEAVGRSPDTWTRRTPELVARCG